MDRKTTSLIILFGVTMLVSCFVANVASQGYGDALSKSILFFEGQRSGKLPPNQRMNWRKDSALMDGSDAGNASDGTISATGCDSVGTHNNTVAKRKNYMYTHYFDNNGINYIERDLSGGYYDAGDNIKFNFPMAFTTTLLAWSAIEFGQQMGPEFKNAADAIRWGTDYFLKSTSVPGSVVAQVGDPNIDHNCWERPEDMDTLRTTYIVNQSHPGSEVSAEIAAALAASSIVFRTIDPAYSKTLLERAASVFDFADKFQGSYANSVGAGVCPFYCDFNGYKDELLWGAAWLYKATNDPKYWIYVQTHIDDISNDNSEFGWDNKDAGINVLISGLFILSAQQNPFVPNADKFVCSVLPESPTKSVTYSPGGLLFKRGGSNLQHTTSLSFLLVVYSRYLEKAHRSVTCGNVVAPPARLVSVAKSQADYILGKNPLGLSYMVGFTNKFPLKIHHRGSSIPSVDSHPQHIQCKEGSQYFESNNPNLNTLEGAIVGGPDSNDKYVDTRNDATTAEPTTYINAPFVGVLAYLNSFKSK